MQETLLVEGSNPKKNTRLSLRMNFSWTFLGNVVYAASQWGILVVLAKLSTPEVVGQFALALAVTAPVFMLTMLQLRAIQATDTKREYKFGTYFLLRLSASFLALLLIGSIALFGGYRLETSIVIFLMGLAKTVEAVSDVFYGLLQQRERMDRIAISMILKGPLSLLALGAVVYQTKSIVWGIVALFLTWSFLLIVYDIPAGRWLLKNDTNSIKDNETLRPAGDLQTLWRLTWLSAPLGVVMMLISLNSSIPRFFIERQQGEYELGIFSALVFLIVTGTTVVQALGQSAMPRLASHYASGDRDQYLRIVKYLTGVGCILAIGGVAVSVVGGKTLLRIIYSAEYAEYADLLTIVMIAGGIQYIASILGYTMTAARYFKVQTILFGLTALSTLVACWILIPTYGIYGAAWALVIAGGVQFLCCLGVNTHAISRLKNIEVELGSSA